MEHKISPDDLRQVIRKFVAEYPQITGENNIWREPLLATAKADDRFRVLTEIAAEDHLMPWELLPSARSVVVFFVPFAKELAVENHSGKIPCRNWGLAYESTNRLINSLCEHLKTYLAERGWQSELTPATHNFDHERLVARWSHKHLGYLAGLGRFGVNAQFITPSGCAGRLGSLATDADLGDSPLVTEEELCLYRLGQNCLVCAKRCPVGAVSVEGIDRQRCWSRLKDNLEHTEELTGLEESTHVCGKCQVFLPCSMKAPRGFKSAGC